MANDINLASCNYTKSILMLAVVLCHSCAFWSGNWFSAITPVKIVPALGWLSSWLGTFHVSSFVLVSGYIFYYLKFEIDKYSDSKSFFLNKFQRLILPYIFVSIIWVIPFAVYFYHYSVIEIFVRFALGTAPSQLWFLLMLFGIFVIIYPLCGYLYKRNWYEICLIAAVFYLLGLGVSHITKNIFQIGSSFMYAPYFLIGFLFRKYLSIKNSKVLVYIGLVGVIINVLLFIIIHDFIDFFFLSNHILKLFRITCDLSGTMGFVCILFVIFRQQKYIRLMDKLSEFSFPIYLFHQQIIYMILVVFNRLLIPELLAGFCLFVSVIMSILVTIILKRWHITKKLIGYK